MDVIYARGNASAKEVAEQIADPPSRTAIRTLLGILVKKGWLTYAKHGREYVYTPVQSPSGMGRQAFRRVLSTFFQGSLEKALAAHLSDDRESLSEEEYQRLSRLIEQARQEESP